MTSPTASLLDRAGLDRNDVRRHLARSLEGADDGELYLEYAPVRDAGVRQRPAQAGDLQHRPGLRPARRQGRGGRLCAFLRPVGGGARARRRRGARRQGRLFRPLRGRARRTPTCGSTATRTRSARRRSRPRCGCWRPSTPMCGRRTRGCGRSRSRSARPGRWSKSCAPTARPIAISGRWCGSTSRSSPATATGRNPAATAPAGARASSASSPPTPGRTPPTSRCARR